MLIQQRATPRATTGAGAFARRFVSLVGLLSIAGCTGGEKLPTVPASGTVTYNGEPLEGATVNFLPKTQAEGAKGAAGQTDSRGRFSVQTYLGGERATPGALPGDYAVSVSKVENLTERLRPGAGGANEVAKIQQEGVAKGAPAGGGPPRGVGPPRMGGGPPGRGGG